MKFPRDPDRINTVIATLWCAWQEHPQLLLVQLLLNLVQDDEVSDLPSRWFFSKAYNLEDDLVVARLRELYLQPGGPSCRNDAHEDGSRK